MWGFARSTPPSSASSARCENAGTSGKFRRKKGRPCAGATHLSASFPEPGAKMPQGLKLVQGPFKIQMSYMLWAFNMLQKRYPSPSPRPQTSPTTPFPQRCLWVREACGATKQLLPTYPPMQRVELLVAYYPALTGRCRVWLSA